MILNDFEIYTIAMHDHYIMWPLDLSAYPRKIILLLKSLVKKFGFFYKTNAPKTTPICDKS